MEALRIWGGRKLSGELEIVTAKNATLPIIAGSIITSKNVVINKVAKFSDVIYMTELLNSLGAECEFQDDKLIINSENISTYEIMEEFTKKIRSSVFMLGPLLSRFRYAKVSYPGGCNIGSRPINLHLKGLQALNVKIEEKHGFIICDGKAMTSGEVHLDFPSVGATENLMMASVKLKGTTTIYNCAREPEIEDLQNFLNSMGAKISGAGSSTITITGVDTLKSTEYTPIKDRIVAGTYLIACAMCCGDIYLKGFEKKHNQALVQNLKNCGANIIDKNNNIRIVVNKRLKSISTIETQPYPGFPTDLQNQILALQSISKGSSVITENLYENRFKICNELLRMGANINVKDRVAIIQGVDKLYGANVVANDLRGGAGLVLAGLVADGYTTVNDVYHIDRGYLSIEEDFCNLNAEIKRINF